jgi:hypothetical protein
MTTDILAQQTADLAVVAKWGLPPEPEDDEDGAASDGEGSET